MTDQADCTAYRRCEFLCVRKKRQCRLHAGKNSTFCVEHIFYQDGNKDETDENLKRIACPLDKKHNVYVKDLEKHLKKCNKREKILGNFYVTNVNRFSTDTEDNDLDENFKNFTIKNLSTDELNAFTERLLEIDNKLNLSKDLDLNFKETEFITEQLCNYESEITLKHLKQISSMVSHIKDQYEPNKKTCFIELGAGRGKLSHYLSLSLDNNELTKYLLIERGSQRHKFENQHLNDDKSFERIRMDIKNLYLTELDSVKECDQCIMYGKHLCGPATDLTLHCLKRTLTQEDKANKFKALLLAVCCHHCCEWSSFCGKELFKELDLNIKDFYIIRNLTSWAVHSSYNQTQRYGNEKIFKEKIGRICKNLIDLARIKYITRTDEFETKFFYYCGTYITLENRMLIVVPKNKSEPSK